MTNKKQNSKEQLEAKVKNYNRLFRASLCTYIAGIALIVSGLLYSTNQHKGILEPRAYKEYISAKTTLSMLENLERQDNLTRRLDFPYQTQEINDVENAIYGDSQRRINEPITKAIIKVQNDISEMENNPEIRSYQAETAQVDKNASMFLRGGFLTALLSTLWVGFSISKKDKYKSQIKKLQ